MTIFRVWAPHAENVELQLQNERRPMIRAGDGWWLVEALEAQPGHDYAFILDGGKPLPDPRSPWQPQGVHRPSRLLDHDAFRWTDAGWRPPPLASALIYELHVGTFTPRGTFEAVIEHLDYLKELGVTHLELLPIAEFPGSHGWGYDGVDLYAPKHSYGGPQGLKKLVDACHSRGLAVLLDVVYNHLGPDGNYLDRFGPYFSDRYHTPWGDAVNFDGPGSEEVRRFFIQNALMWLRDYHLDGLRLDAVHAIFDNSALHFLEQLAQEVQALQEELGRPLVLIAESDLNDPRLVRPPAAGGYGLDAQWSDDFHHALHAVLTGEQDGYYQDFGKLADLATALQQAYVYAGRYSPHRRRRHGRLPTAQPGSSEPPYLPGSRFLAYLQNHDQIGNRAQGDRLSQSCSTELLKIGAALVLTSPFVPMLFQGEEWGASSPFLYFADHQDAALAEAVRAGRRQEFAAFGWDPADVPDPQAAHTFQRSKLNWEERDNQPHAALLQWHRALIRLRRQQPALRDHRLEQVRTDFDESERWFILYRRPLAIACNLASRPQQLPLAAPPCNLLLSSSGDATLTPEGVHLPGPAVAIVEMST